MPNGGAEFQAAQALQAERGRSIRERVLAQREFVGDTRVTEEHGPSPLDLPKKSYTSHAEPGGASRIADIERTQAASRKMTATAEGFIGGPAVPTAPEATWAPEEAGAPAGERRRATPEPEENPFEEEVTEGRGPEAEAVANIEASRARSLLTLRQRLQLNSYAEAMGAVSEQQARDRAIHMAWGRAKAALAASSITLVTLLVLILMLNIQVINTFTFKHRKIPPANAWDVCLTLFIDLIAATLLAVIVYALIMIAAVIAEAANLVG